MCRTLRIVPVLLLIVSLASWLWPRGAETVPLFAARTGLMCESCHFDPNGGGQRNELGFAFAKNRHNLAPETDTPWAELDLRNRVSAEVPIYFGVNQRFMLFTNDIQPPSDSLDRLGFVNMESAIHMVFQPHEMLLLSYSRNGLGAVSSVDEGYGMIRGLPVNGYVRVGSFRTPYGLRMDDHTVATRQSFTDFTSRQSFLPYDPRLPDMGVEIGARSGGWLGRFAFTNGSASPRFGIQPQGTFAETKTAKVGHNVTWYEGGLSFYDRYTKTASSPSQMKRETRWGYYGLSHYGPVAFVGEIGAGTDERVSGVKTNLLAFFGEVNYTPWRGWNFRLRYDRDEFDRSTDPQVRKDNTYDRYTIEGEWVPVPFAELRWTLRRIDHRGSNAAGTQNDEKQAYLQMHFIY